MESHTNSWWEVLDQPDKDGNVAIWHCRMDAVYPTNVAILTEGGVFEIKDSGKREEFTGGMVRDTAEGKTNYLLVRDGPMLKRWAQHLTNGAKKYAKRNWMKGEGMAELDRAMESADRHFAQYMAGDIDEDHAAAVFFNINQIEYLKEKMQDQAMIRILDASSDGAPLVSSKVR